MSKTFDVYNQKMDRHLGHVDGVSNPHQAARRVLCGTTQPTNVWVVDPMNKTARTPYCGCMQHFPSKNGTGNGRNLPVVRKGHYNGNQGYNHVNGGNEPPTNHINRKQPQFIEEEEEEVDEEFDEE